MNYSEYVPIEVLMRLEVFPFLNKDHFTDVD
jgi:hypothetical protein